MKQLTWLVSIALVISACAFDLTPTETPAPSATPVRAGETKEATGPAQPPPDEAAEKRSRAGPTGAAGPRLAARVNGRPIFLDDYEKQVAQFEQSLRARGVDLAGEAGQAQLGQIRRQILDALIDQALIMQEADRLGLAISDEQLEARARASAAQGMDQSQFEAWLAANQMTYDDFKETLQAQLLAGRLFEQMAGDIPERAEQVQVRQIVVADEATAQSIIDQLKNGASFSTLAQEHSLDEDSREDGGDVGWFPRGAGPVPVAVEEIAFSLPPRSVSGPIPTALGFHIILIEAREADRPLKSETLQVLQEKLFNDWLAERRSAGVIEVFVTP